MTAAAQRSRARGRQGGSSSTASVMWCTVAAYATVTPADVMDEMFKQVVHRLLQAATTMVRVRPCVCARACTTGRPHSPPPQQQSAAGSPERVQATRSAVVLTSLARALSRHLSRDQLQLLYRVIKPGVASDDVHALVQKRFYAALEALCEHHPAFVMGADVLPDITSLLRASLVTCAAPGAGRRIATAAAAIRWASLLTAATRAQPSAGGYAACSTSCATWTPACRSK